MREPRGEESRPWRTSAARGNCNESKRGRESERDRATEEEAERERKKKRERRAERDRGEAECRYTAGQSFAPVGQ